jgi:hypothetical protein
MLGDTAFWLRGTGKMKRSVAIAAYQRKLNPMRSGDQVPKKELYAGVGMNECTWDNVPPTAAFMDLALAGWQAARKAWPGNFVAAWWAGGCPDSTLFIPLMKDGTFDLAMVEGYSYCPGCADWPASAACCSNTGTQAYYPKLDTARKHGFINRTVFTFGWMIAKSNSNPLGWTVASLRSAMLDLKTKYPEVPGVIMYGCSDGNATCMPEGRNGTAALGHTCACKEPETLALTLAANKMMKEFYPDLVQSPTSLPHKTDDATPVGISLGPPQLVAAWRITNGIYQAVSERLHRPQPDRYRPTKTDDPCVVAGKAKASCFGVMNATDSTAMLQSALNSNASELLIEHLGRPWLTRPLFVTTRNMRIVFAPGVKLLAMVDEFHGGSDSLLTLRGVSNVSIEGQGAVLQMRRDDYASPPRGTCPECRPYSKAEWRMGIMIIDSENILIQDLKVVESGGDGIYVAGISSPGVRNLHIQDVTLDRNYRQGMSVISAIDLLVERTQFSNTHGTSPAGGVDLEPNHAKQQLTNVTFKDCTSFNNSAGLAGYFKHLNGSSVPISITVINWTSYNNVFGAHFGAMELGLRGQIIVVDSLFTDHYDSGVYIIDKAVPDSTIVFRRCRIDGAAQSNYSMTHELSPVQITARNASAFGKVGNVTFDQCEVADSANRCWLGTHGATVESIRGSVIVHNPHLKACGRGCLGLGSHMDVAVTCANSTAVNQQSQRLKLDDQAGGTRGPSSSSPSNKRLSAKRLPSLDWAEPRSDWLSVKSMGAVGDDMHDDTAAIQAALDLASNKSWVAGSNPNAYCQKYTECSGNRTVYFPPGAYRISQTLVQYRLMGGAWVGHGEASVLSWHGPENGTMMHSIGWARSRYVGIVWDGRGVARVGVNHDPTSGGVPHMAALHGVSADDSRAAGQEDAGPCGKPAYLCGFFETRVRHEHERFSNFTFAAILAGEVPRNATNQKVELSEVMYFGVIFSNNAEGVALKYFNDYDNLFDGCWFENCGIGIRTVVGRDANIYVRNCNFRYSSNADIQLDAQANSVKRCVSIGSASFISMSTAGGPYNGSHTKGNNAHDWSHTTGIGGAPFGPATVAGNLVVNWTGPAAIHFPGRGPLILYENSFVNADAVFPPVLMDTSPKLQSALVLGSNSVNGIAMAGPAATVDPTNLGSLSKLLWSNASTTVTIEPLGVAATALATPLDATTSFIDARVSTLTPNAGRVLDVKRDFHAVGDGVCDDTAAIQAAIVAAAAATDSPTIYLPAGTYRISRSLVVNGSNYTIAGSGFYSQLLWGPEAPHRPNQNNSSTKSCDAVVMRPNASWSEFQVHHGQGCPYCGLHHGLSCSAAGVSRGVQACQKECLATWATANCKTNPRDCCAAVLWNPHGPHGGPSAGFAHAGCNQTTLRPHPESTYILAPSASAATVPTLAVLFISPTVSAVAINQLSILAGPKVAKLLWNRTGRSASNNSLLVDGLLRHGKVCHVDAN